MNTTILIIIFVFIIFRDMSWIKDFNQLPMYIKSIFITLLLVLPFWFFIIWNYYPMLSNQKWYIILTICLVPSIIWYSINIASSYIASFSLKEDINLKTKDVTFWFIIGIETIIHLVVMSLIMIGIGFTFKQLIIGMFFYKLLFLIFTKPLCEYALNVKK